MSVQIKYTTLMKDFRGRHARMKWFHARIPTEEYFFQTPSSNNDDGWDPDDNIETIVTVWANDADRIATEFWFQFP